MTARLPPNSHSLQVLLADDGVHLLTPPAVEVESLRGALVCDEGGMLVTPGGVVDLGPEVAREGRQVGVALRGCWSRPFCMQH
jgi:hypothetical protein